MWSKTADVVKLYSYENINVLWGRISQSDIQQNFTSRADSLTEVRAVALRWFMPASSRWNWINLQSSEDFTRPCRWRLPRMYILLCRNLSWKGSSRLPFYTAMLKSDLLLPRFPADSEWSQNLIFASHFLFRVYLNTAQAGLRKRRIWRSTGCRMTSSASGTWSHQCSIMRTFTLGRFLKALHARNWDLAGRPSDYAQMICLKADSWHLQRGRCV